LLYSEIALEKNNFQHCDKYSYDFFVRYVDGIQTDRLRIAFILLQLINRDTQI
jgi:hypothetical protein